MLLICLSVLAICGPAWAAGLRAAGEARGPAEDTLRSPQDWSQVYYLHIPKGGGLSFGNDALEVLHKGKINVVSKEGCYSNVRDDPKMIGAAVMLRRPAKHLASQYNFCAMGILSMYRDAVRPASSPSLPDTYAGWLRAWKDVYDSGEWRKDFTPEVGYLTSSFYEHSLRDLRMKSWESPPFNIKGTHLKLEDWQTADGGGTIWHHVHMPFQCYSPINAQTHRLSCDRPMNYTTTNFTLAVANLHQSWYTGILEEYHVSVCLLQAKATKTVPKYCDCTNQQAWAMFPGTKVNAWKHKQQAPLTPQDVEIVKELTADDRHLYREALKKFVDDVRAAEKELGSKMLCKDDAEVLALGE